MDSTELRATHADMDQILNMLLNGQSKLQKTMYYKQVFVFKKLIFTHVFVGTQVILKGYTYTLNCG